LLPPYPLPIYAFYTVYPGKGRGLKSITILKKKTFWIELIRKKLRRRKLG